MFLARILDLRLWINPLWWHFHFRQWRYGAVSQVRRLRHVPITDWLAANHVPEMPYTEFEEECLIAVGAIPAREQPVLDTATLNDDLGVEIIAWAIGDVRHASPVYQQAFQHAMSKSDVESLGEALRNRAYWPKPICEAYYEAIRKQGSMIPPPKFIATMSLDALEDCYRRYDGGPLIHAQAYVEARAKLDNVSIAPAAMERLRFMAGIRDY